MIDRISSAVYLLTLIGSPDLQHPPRVPLLLWSCCLALRRSGRPPRLCVALSGALGLHLSGRSLLAARATHQQRTKPLDDGWSCLQTATTYKYFVGFVAREDSRRKQINILTRWFGVGMQARVLFSDTSITRVEYTTKRKGSGGTNRIDTESWFKCSFNIVQTGSCLPSDRSTTAALTRSNILRTSRLGVVRCCNRISV